ncbi:hypothetical protein [Mycoplasma wenyonii]|uniref:hypothetical protein n=1 Tax=Mycoplasma wenyonii TaxID=65123 RepID=UPI001C661A1A|nr:hypothetical protein [Mycoplasma wenyonii]
MYSRTMRQKSWEEWWPSNDGTLDVGFSLEKCEVKGENVECSLRIINCVRTIFLVSIYTK